MTVPSSATRLARAKRSWARQDQFSIPLPCPPLASAARATRRCWPPQAQRTRAPPVCARLSTVSAPSPTSLPWQAPVAGGGAKTPVLAGGRRRLTGALPALGSHVVRAAPTPVGRGTDVAAPRPPRARRARLVAPAEAPSSAVPPPGSRLWGATPPMTCLARAPRRHSAPRKDSC